MDEAGDAWTYADARTAVRDFAKICQVMLDGGRWSGIQVVPEAWVRASVQPTAQNPEYGLLWWRISGGFATRGHLDTNCYAFPDLNLVVARMQARPRPDAAEPYENPATEELFRRMVRQQLVQSGRNDRRNDNKGHANPLGRGLNVVHVPFAR